MAGDWLKIEVSLPDKPEVWHLSSITGLDADTVVGKLIKVWRWFDAHTEAGNACFVSDGVIDSLTSCSGFGEAMRLVGWLIVDGPNLTLPNFSRHNGKTAKDRALTAKRVASHKARGNDNTNARGNAPVVTVALPREEKRREEKDQKKAAVAAVDFGSIEPQVLADFRALRKAKKAAITQTAVDGITREAKKAGLTLQEALAMCCERGWAGFKADWVGDKTKAAQPGGGRKEL